MNWYAVSCNPRSEAIANGWLQDQDYLTFWPHYETEITHARRKKTVLRSYFSGYLFCDISDGSFGVVNKTIGVNNALHTQPVADVVMDSLRKNCGEDGRTDEPVTGPVKIVFKIGQVLSISNGPLSGLPCTLISCTEQSARCRLFNNLVVTLPLGALAHPDGGAYNKS